MYDLNWREKPNAKIWKELICQQRWNDFDGVSNAQGQYGNRGFYGKYQVNVTVGNETKTFNFELKAGESNVFTLFL